MDELQKIITPYDIQKPIRSFTGREKEFEELTEFIKSTKTRLILINGLGGIGKTELARKFFYSVSLQVTSTWVPIQKLKIFHTTLKNFRIGIDNQNGEGTFENQLYGIYRKWLVIIDGADQIDQKCLIEVITTVLSYPYAHVIVTSVVNLLIPLKHDILKLSGLLDKDAMQLIISELDLSSENNPNFLELIKALDNFPLVLQQAIAYIKKQKRITLRGKYYVIRDFLEDFKMKEEQILGHDLILEGYKKTSLTAWNDTIQNILNEKHGDLAYKILEALSLLGSTSIAKDKLKLLVDVVTGLENFEMSLILLEKHSMISTREEMVIIPCLVVKVIRFKMDSEAWENMVRKLLQLKQTNEAISISIDLIRKIFKAGIVDNKVGHNVASMLKKHGAYEGAIKCYDLLLKNPNHPSNEEELFILYKKAVCLIKEGLIQKARKELEYVSQQRQKLLGQGHISTLKSQYWLTVALIKTGELRMAVICINSILKNDSSGLLKNKVDSLVEEIKLVESFVIIPQQNIID